MTKIKNTALGAQQGFVLMSSVFNLGSAEKIITPPLTKNSSFSADGKRVPADYFRLATFSEDKISRFHVSIKGEHVADNCISDKLASLTSTIEFHPSGSGPIAYLFVSQIIRDKETSEIKYIVKQGKKTMGDRHVKVFEVKD